MKRHLRPWLFSLIALLLASEGIRAWWFSGGSDRSAAARSLAWRPPRGAIDVGLSNSRASEMLRYDFGQQLRLEDAGGQVTSEVTYLDYEAGNARVLPDLYMHSPEICLPASGVTLVRELPAQTFPVSGQELLVRRWLFQAPRSGEPIYAFKTVWSGDDDFLQGTLYSRDLREARLEAARAGREFAAARMILAVTFGLEDDEEAWVDFQERVLSHLVMEEAGE